MKKNELVFYYGTMSSSKTANALMTRFQYLEKGNSVLLVKPSIDNRAGETTVSSRVGIQAEADMILKPEDSFKKRYLDEYLTTNEPPDVIIVDEAQFLTPEQVDDLKFFTATVHSPVYCYGLRTDFRTKLFDGSKRLFEVADRLIELESICECGDKALFSARYNKGKLVIKGQQVDIGGDDKYKAVCYKCWYIQSHQQE